MSKTVDNAVSRNVSFKKFLNPDSKADVFQKLISPSLFIDRYW